MEGTNIDKANLYLGIVASPKIDFDARPSCSSIAEDELGSDFGEGLGFDCKFMWSYKVETKALHC